MIDYALAVDRLIPLAQYSDASSYERLEATWFDARPIPTDMECQTAWDAHQAEKAIEEANTDNNTAKVAAAKTAAKNIPNWATWDEATALAWFDVRLADVNINAIGSLAEAKPILRDMATVNRALIRMVLALRDDTWPGLDRA